MPSRRLLPSHCALAFPVLMLLQISLLAVRANPPILPTIPPGTFYVTNFGAIGDGITTDTTAIQNAINAAGTNHGGTVDFSPGTFLSGPLSLSNSVSLQLESGAILRMLPYGQYPGGTSPTDFITASSLQNLEITGAGTIDGQGGTGWWTNGLSTSERPKLINLNKCNRILIQNVTLENPPSMHIVFKGSGSGNITIQGITINTPGNSPNTDGIDLLGTNCLVQNCSISAGDDNIALGSSAGTSSDTVITNCSFGVGHGLSIGGNTLGGVSNLTVINCTFNGTEYGIRMKSDNASSSPGAGGLVQNLSYYNIGMTNIVLAPIVIYSYYNEVGTPTGISPSDAASEAVPTPVPATTVMWRNIVISNVTATAPGGIAGIIWGRTEMPATNITFDHVNITAGGSFDAYNVYGFQLIDSQITPPSGTNTFEVFNAGIILSNRSSQLGTVTVDGLTSTNSLGLYNASAATTATDVLGADPITLTAGTLAVSNDLSFPAATTLNFGLGSTASTITASGKLALNGAVINVTNASGFGAGTYTLFTYTGTLTGKPVLNSAPTNFNYTFDTNTAGLVKLTVTAPGPSLSPVSLVIANLRTNLQLSWPTDHIGWHLEAQTNQVNGTNWVIVAGSYTTNEIFFPINPANAGVFLRLKYP